MQPHMPGLIFAILNPTFSLLSLEPSKSTETILPFEDTPGLSWITFNSNEILLTFFFSCFYTATCNLSIGLDQCPQFTPQTIVIKVKRILGSSRYMQFSLLKIFQII